MGNTADAAIIHSGPVDDSILSTASLSPSGNSAVEVSMLYLTLEPIAISLTAMCGSDSVIHRLPALLHGPCY